MHHYYHAIADLTITYEREQAVDFSMPFMNLGIRYPVNVRSRYIITTMP